MRLSQVYIFLGVLIIAGMMACKHKTRQEEAQSRSIFKGLYSFEPGTKTFQPCGRQTEFWVADSSAQLELKYSQLISFEKPGEQVYVEVEGEEIKSVAGGDGAAYDSTLVVKKLIKIAKDIPANCK